MKNVSLILAVLFLVACTNNNETYTNYVLRIVSTGQLVSSAHASFAPFKIGETFSARIVKSIPNAIWIANQHPITKDTTMKKGMYTFEMRRVTLVRFEKIKNP